MSMKKKIIIITIILISCFVFIYYKVYRTNYYSGTYEKEKNEITVSNKAVIIDDIYDFKMKKYDEEVFYIFYDYKSEIDKVIVKVINIEGKVKDEFILSNIDFSLLQINQFMENELFINNSISYENEHLLEYDKKANLIVYSISDNTFNTHNKYDVINSKSVGENKLFLIEEDKQLFIFDYTNNVKYEYPFDKDYTTTLASYNNYIIYNGENSLQFYNIITDETTVVETEFNQEIISIIEDKVIVKNRSEYANSLLYYDSNLEANLFSDLSNYITGSRDMELNIDGNKFIFEYLEKKLDDVEGNTFKNFDYSLKYFDYSNKEIHDVIKEKGYIYTPLYKDYEKGYLYIQKFNLETEKETLVILNDDFEVIYDIPIEFGLYGIPEKKFVITYY